MDSLLSKLSLCVCIFVQQGPIFIIYTTQVQTFILSTASSFWENRQMNLFINNKRPYFQYSLQVLSAPWQNCTNLNIDRLYRLTDMYLLNFEYTFYISIYIYTIHIFIQCSNGRLDSWGSSQYQLIGHWTTYQLPTELLTPPTSSEIDGYSSQITLIHRHKH